MLDPDQPCAGREAAVRREQQASNVLVMQPGFDRTRAHIKRDEGLAGDMPCDGGDLRADRGGDGGAGGGECRAADDLRHVQGGGSGDVHGGHPGAGEAWGGFGEL